MKDIYKTLNDLHIAYDKYEHKPVFTVAEAEKMCLGVPGAHTKNLFLRNKSGDRHYLVTMDAYRRADLKKLQDVLGEKKLSFASPERLMNYLGLTPGSVSPMGLINDEKKEVVFCLDKSLLDADKINMHPNDNAASIVMSMADLQKFLEWWGGETREVEI